MLRVIATRKNILGEDEWLVEWADLRPDGTKYPNDWVPDGNVSKDLKKAFRLSASFELKAPRHSNVTWSSDATCNSSRTWTGPCWR